MDSKLNKHRLMWFENRVGKEIIKDESSDLFTEPILIASKQHAKALYINQSKGYKYKELCLK